MSLITHQRTARHQHFEHIYNAHQYAVRYTCARNYSEAVLQAWLALLSPDSYLDTLEDERKLLWVIEFKHHIQGFFQLNLQESQLDALYVHPFVQRQGLGTALLSRAEELAYQHGLGMLKLYASLNSEPFYLLNGYRPLGEAMLPLNQEIGIECRLMRKLLTDCR